LSATLDGADAAERPLRVPLLEDAQVRHVQVTLGMLAVPGAGKRELWQSVGSL
jgi:hypothetical protein